MKARRFVREPLLHFLLGGVAIFGLYGWRGHGPQPDPERIVVTENQVAVLVTSFERTWLRPPTNEELRGLIDDFVTEEVLYREALKLGLDRGDLVVRRRMRQKMEFLHEDLRDVTEPTDVELGRFLEEQPDAFREPERLSFRQLFVATENAGRSARDRALRLLERVRSEPAGPLDELGDPTLLPRELEAVTHAEIGHRFGEGFARALAHLPAGIWAGPVASEFGLHLVLVTERRPARLPELPGIRARVAREWESERRRESAARFRRMLRERYEIEVPPSIQTAPPTVASRAP